MYSIRFCALILLFFCVLNVDAQPIFTNERQRVTTICHKEYSGANIIMDSLSFRYSGNRGSVFNPIDFMNTIYYDPHHYGFSSYDGYIAAYPRSLYAADMQEPLEDLLYINVLYDTMHGADISINNSGSRVTVSNATVNKQYVNGKLTQINTNMPSLLRRTAIAYDADKRPVTFYVIEYHPQATDTTFQRVITYNINGRILSDTSYEKLFLGKDSSMTAFNYQYNADGRVVKIRYDLRTKSGVSTWEKILAYNAKGKMERIMLLYEKPGGLPDTMELNKVTYDESDRIIAYARQNGVTSEPIFEIHYNAVGDADTFTRYLYDYFTPGLYTVNKTTFFYNSFHNPDSAVTFSYGQSSGDIVIYHTTYNYETYFADTLKSTEPLILYPNPAKDKVYIKWNSVQPDMPVYIYIYNSIGQLADRTYIAKAQYVDIIPISQIAGGIYFVKIITSSGSTLYKGGLVIK